MTEKLKKLAKNILKIFRIFGIDFVKMWYSLFGLGYYIGDSIKIIKQRKKNKDFKIRFLNPVLDERFTESGIIKGHYFQQDLLVANKIYLNNPNKHVDVGSRIDGFVAHVASFREIEVFDIRKLDKKIKNILFRRIDFMNIGEDLVSYCDSVSSLHAIEHFGLGRYGDPVDYYGHIKAIENIYIMLKPGGKFYFSVPMGRQRIEFNAHRVFSLKYLMNLFINKFKVESLSYIDDEGKLFCDVMIKPEDIENSYGCTYGCVIIEMVKI